MHIHSSGYTSPSRHSTNERAKIDIKIDMNNDALKISNLYDLNETIAAKVFEDCTYPWEVLAKIGDFIVELGNSL